APRGRSSPKTRRSSPASTPTGASSPRFNVIGSLASWLWPNNRNAKANMIGAPLRFESQSKGRVAGPAGVTPGPARAHSGRATTAVHRALSGGHGTWAGDPERRREVTETVIRVRHKEIAHERPTREADFSAILGRSNCGDRLAQLQLRPR